MRNIKQVALKPMIYAGRRLVAGDEFMATRGDARILQKIGKSGKPQPRVQEMKAQEPQKRGPGRPRKERPVEQPIETKAIEASVTETPEEPVEVQESAASEAYNRLYGRRDMEAED